MLLVFMYIFNYSRCTLYQPSEPLLTARTPHLGFPLLRVYILHPTIEYPLSLPVIFSLTTQEEAFGTLTSVINPNYPPPALKPPFTSKSPREDVTLEYH